MTALDMTAAAIVLLCGLFGALNRMCRRTAVVIRITWIVLTVGAAAVLLAGGDSAWPEVLFHWGIAALVLVDRRRRFLRGTTCN